MGTKFRTPVRSVKDPDDSGDDMDEMRRTKLTVRLDDQSANRMLSGDMPVEDAVPGYGPVIRLLEEARSEIKAGPAANGGRASEQEVATVAAMQAALLGRVVPIPDSRRTSMRSRIMAPKAAVTAGIILLGAGTAAAAVTGNLLPSHASHHAGTTKGIETTTGQVSTTTGPGDQGTSNGGTISPTSSSSGGPSVQATFGLCTAFLAGSSNTGSSTTISGKYASTAFKALIAAHGGTVAATTTFCQTYVKDDHPGKAPGSTTTTTTGVPHTGLENPGSSHRPTGSDHGSSPNSVSTPNPGGAATANSASGGVSDQGTNTANVAGGGSSGHGSVNSNGSSAGSGAGSAHGASGNGPANSSHSSH